MNRFQMQRKRFLIWRKATKKMSISCLAKVGSITDTNHRPRKPRWQALNHLPGLISGSPYCQESISMKSQMSSLFRDRTQQRKNGRRFSTSTQFLSSQLSMTNQWTRPMTTWLRVYSRCPIETGSVTNSRCTKKIDLPCSTVFQI